MINDYFSFFKKMASSVNNINMKLPKSITIMIDGRRHRITFNDNIQFYNCQFGETDPHHYNIVDSDGIIKTTCVIQPIVERRRRPAEHNESSLRKQLREAIEERDALLELKKERNLRIEAEESARIAKVKSHVKAKELRDAKEQLERLKLHHQKKQELQSAKKELARLKALKASLNTVQECPTAPRKLARTAPPNIYSTQTPTIHQRWQNDGVGLTTTLSQNRTRRRINFQAQPSTHKYNLRPRY